MRDTECELLVSARGVWESKEKSFETGNGVVVKGFRGSSGRGGLFMPPSPHGLSADSNRPRQRGERTNSRQARGRSTSRGGEEVEPMTTEVKIGAVRLLHPPLGLPYTPSLPDDSSDPDADPDSLRKDSTDSNTNLLCLKDVAGSMDKFPSPQICWPVQSERWWE